MPLEQIFLFSAKIIVAATLAFFLISVLLLGLELKKIRTKSEKSDTAKLAAYGGLIGASVIFVTLLFFIEAYFKIQSERKDLLNQIKGVSVSIDSEISKSVENRLSFFHTQGIVDKARLECIVLRIETENSIPTACAKIPKITAMAESKHLIP